MKRITFVTTGQPTTNPRLVKEVDTMIRLGYQVKVIYCFYQAWAENFDSEIIDNSPGVYICCGGSPKNFKITYFKTRLRQKISTLLSRYTNFGFLYENAVHRAHKESLALALSIDTDIYIAHNLGALPAAVLAAKANNAKVGYDAEDMNSGFSIPGSEAYFLNKQIEDKYIPLTDYFTAASQAIGAEYKKTYPFLQPVVIRNVFKRTECPFREKQPGGPSIKLFWLSQTIGTNRGIEDIIEAMHLLNTPQLELHLFGNLTDADFKSFIENQRTLLIKVYPPVAPSAIEKIAGQFDIGLATETAYCLNNDIALSNKVFTYIQAGLAVIVSDTIGQKNFLAQFPQSGKSYLKNDAKSLATCISDYINEREQLYATRLLNYNLGQTVLNWEVESRIFTDIVKVTLKAI